MNEKTPGRAAYEALAEAAGGSFDIVPETPWDDMTAREQEAVEAAAQAAIDAHAMTGILTAVKAESGDTIVIAFNRPVSAQLAHEVRDRWTAYAPGVTLVLVDDVAAVQAYKP